MLFSAQTAHSSFGLVTDEAGVEQILLCAVIYLEIIVLIILREW